VALPRRTSGNTIERVRGGNVTIAHPADVKLAALTAAAQRVDKRNSGQMRRLVQAWQILALSYYDTVGECWNAAQFRSRSLKKVRIFAGEVDDSGEITETENPKAKAVVARIQDPGGGGYSRLLDAYGRLTWMIGEGYYLITESEDGDEQWEFVSPLELRINGDGNYTRFAAPSLPAELLQDIPDTAFKPIGDEAEVFRIWRPSPSFSKLADSPIRAQLRILEELELLTLAVGARAKSRMAANGILYLPDELTTETVEPGQDDDPHADPLLREVIEGLVAGIVNPGTAAAAAPFVMRGPAEWGDKIKWIQIANPEETYPEEGLRTELIRRFAVGVEMPAEALTGTGDVNHWGAALIDDQAARDYIFPVCDDLVGELTSIFMRPVLREDDVPDWERYVVGYDAAAVVAHPDAGKDAKDLHDRIVISDQALRERTNFIDEDAPSDEEWHRRAALKMNNAAALGYAEEVPATDDVNEDAQVTGEEGGPEPDDTVPATEPPTGEDATTNGEALSAKVAGACAHAIIRHRELAGARLRSRLTAGSDLPLPDGFDGEVSNDLLASRLGMGWVREHDGRNEMALVTGAASNSLIATLKSLGVANDRAVELSQMVAVHAAKTLFSGAPADLPRGVKSFIVAATR
jgi:hypothetical protein